MENLRDKITEGQIIDAIKEALPRILPNLDKSFLTIKTVGEGSGKDCVVDVNVNIPLIVEFDGSGRLNGEIKRLLFLPESLNYPQRNLRHQQ